MSSDLLAPLDLAFWHLESAGHPMHLGALARFDPAPGEAPDSAPGAAAGDAASVLALLAERAAAIPRLRMRVRDVLLPVGGARWSVDETFDVHRHVRHVRLPQDQDGDFAAAATRLAGELMERPLARELPPWEMYLLTGTPGGPFAVLVKLHHALADGMRAVAIGAGIFDEIADARPRTTTTTTTVRRPRPATPRSWLPGPWHVAGVAGAVRGRAEELGRALGVGASVLGASAVRAGRHDPHGTPALAAETSGTRRLATAELDLEEVRRVRRVTGGTANDVLLAVVAGALRHWLLERGDPLPAADPCALVPVSRRRPGVRAGSGSGSPPDCGNRFSAYLLDLPLGDPDPLSRLAAVRRGMDRNKAAGPSRGPGAVAVLADQLPPLAHRFGTPLAGGAARMLFDLLVTNVPLPRSTLSLAGSPLRALYPMAPLARGQALAIAMSPYGGRVHTGLVADGRALPDLDRIAHALHTELAALVKATDRSSGS
ncbi:wax ester/triacylglycerol synthase family O-acyltransferase [Streptomyces sp. NPDC045431]|uniref:wax ester/triacylglycerol synthase family O-acyltransferase n=1 Tax=Streptomyces sp. NPDC045431 TaxID=3155613 RepID=UPI0034021E2C